MKTGVILARFQPIHNGHLPLIKKACDENEQVLVIIGFETITSWFPGFLLRNNVSLSLLARNTCEDGVSATMVRDMILADSLPENNVVPQCVYDMRQTIKAFLNVFK